MGKKRLLFLDMDGVLADFVGGVCHAHGRASPYSQPENLGKFELEPLWGISSTEFWKPTNSREFWLELEEMPDAQALVAAATDSFGLDAIAVLTAPSLFDGCISAKREWIERHFPQFHGRVIYCAAQSKRFLAGPDRYLVDDRDKNIDEWKAAGGEGILVPRLWNKAFVVAEFAVDCVEDTLKHAKRT